MKRLKRRVADWKRKFHAVIDLPVKPERITKRDIERLKEIKWKNLADIEKKKAREEYEYKYEQKMPEIYNPVLPYTPPTEHDYYDNPDYGADYDREWEEQHPDWNEDEDGYTETIDSRAEIEQWINDVIETISVDREIPDARNRLISLVEDAARANDYSLDFYHYLEKNTAKFNKLAIKAMHGYILRNSEIKNLDAGGENAMPQFITLLNYGKPLDVYQSAEFTETGHVTFDTTDL